MEADRERLKNFPSAFCDKPGDQENENQSQEHDTGGLEVIDPFNPIKFLAFKVFFLLTNYRYERLKIEIYLKGSVTYFLASLYINFDR